MENTIVPFGKYKGQPIEVMAQDHQYIEWIQQQGWLAEKYPQINTLIINNFSAPSETPDHNKIQGMFLDDEFLNKFIRVYLKKVNKNIITPKKTWPAVFETNAIDVLFGFDYNYDNRECGVIFKIEIKPSLGDDYPAVLRQIKSLKHTGYSYGDVVDVLFISEYTGVGITQDQVIKLFNNMGITVMFIHEVI